MPLGMVISVTMRSTVSILRRMCFGLPSVHASVTFGRALTPNACVSAGTNINRFVALP